MIGLVIAVITLWIGICCSRVDGGNVGSRFKDIRVHSPERIEHGIIMGAKIYEGVCWYEYLQHYVPKTRSLDFNQCTGQGTFQRNMILKQRADERYFGQFLLKYGMVKLPEEYMKCAPFLLEDRYKVPRKDYMTVLNDTAESSAYPYQAFSYCLISILHEKYKNEGLHKLVERLKEKKDWSQTMYERENEFRALHSSEPLVYNDELTRRAQKWANQLARDCQMYHIHSSHPDYFLNSSRIRMGENLFTGDGIHNPKEDMALFGTNIWYEEIEHYPWPEYKGYGEHPFHEFAHFSQMIWKDTREVGYGYAINSSENCGQYFIVARYFPPGNWYELFGENVLPLVLPSTKEPESSTMTETVVTATTEV
ncbi:Cell wall protein PRY3 [Orchesella cincta]|uniref:Cell wall protein PRY3 n=1 Tax=Orchesella cincta TaxID=48709 RepID=A0A1D2N3U4_ORCCI|nr:Cell wall protein PRY3 [Orchesella cincta]